MTAGLIALTLLPTPNAPLGSQQARPISVKPAFATAPVGTDSDDPAIVYVPENPSHSLILGTDKSEAPAGGIVGFNLQGKQVFRLGNVDRPNNIDVWSGRIGGRKRHLAVFTERMKRRLRILEILPGDKPSFRELSGRTAVFAGEEGEDAAPMGIALGMMSGRLFAWVSPKAGPKENHIAQYELHWNGSSRKVDLSLTRRFGSFSGVKETESIAFDPQWNQVIYSDETVCTWIYNVDARADVSRPVIRFNGSGTKGDHEGIAIWPTNPWGGGYLVLTDQLKGNSVYRVFDRQTRKFLGAFSGGADETDGIDLCARPLPGFPNGIFVAMNSKDRNFLVYDLGKIARALKLKL